MRKFFWLARALAVLMAAGTAFAGVSEEEAERLEEDGDLTPWGAEKAGNEDGSIPAWDGGLTEIPDCYEGEGSWYCNPFPGDAPVYVITADNVDQYADLLSEGQKAMFETYPESYKMPVYETRRNFRNPQFIYEGTRRNATEAELGGGGEALEGAINGYPFPIPKSGHEVIWNHKTRYLGRWVQRWNNQFAVTRSGRYNRVTIREDVYFPYNNPGMEPEDLDNVLIYFLQVVTEPPRLAGTITLVHETMDQVKEPRRAWQYNPGQRRLRRAPNVAYDNPGTASDGLRTNDQTDTFNGAMDRYTWKLVGKKEMYIPYNSYLMNNPVAKYRDIVGKGHTNQGMARYELHRVWVVDATLRQGTRHQFGKRRFYVDEDSWGIVAVDNYDQRGDLWRFQEGHVLTAPFVPTATTAPETIYDLKSGRYFVTAMSNEGKITDWEIEYRDGYFGPSALKRRARRR